MAAETQTYINEVNAPAVIADGVVNAQTKAAQQLAGRVLEQMGRYQRFVDDALSTEVNEQVKGTMREALGKYKALVHWTTQLQASLRDLRATYAELQAAEAAFKAAALQAGENYTGV